MPSARGFDAVARLAGASSSAYTSAVRDSVVHDIGPRAAVGTRRRDLCRSRHRSWSRSCGRPPTSCAARSTQSDYKNYIFSILFLKRLSDRFDEEVENAVASGVAREVALTDWDEHEFFVPESARWPAFTGASMNRGEALNIASHAIEEANPRLDGVLAATNWNDESKLGSPANREGIIQRLLNHFGDLDLRDENLREDSAGGGNVLGDAYEYLINRFADDAGKKGGEFYTPRSVVGLIVRLLRPTEGMRICDPTAGSGGMLIYAAQYVREHGGNLSNLALHGQERNLGTLAIGKLNLLLHGLRSARLEPGDVIAEPGLVDDVGRLLSYDRVIANPPFSLKSWGHDFAPNDPHHRFDRYGAIPPKTRGDLAFLLHMLGVTNSQGMVGVVMPHGVLFRGGSEGKIRRGIIEADLFEAVIGLAPNLFSGASIPVAICVLNKAKPVERRGQGAVRGRVAGGQLPARQGEELYRQGAHRQGSSRRTLPLRTWNASPTWQTWRRCEANDFNLNISRYVDTTEPVEVMSVEDALGATAGMLSGGVMRRWQRWTSCSRSWDMSDRVAGERCRRY